MFGLAVKASESAAAIDDVAQRTNMSAKTLQEFKYAAEESGFSLDTIEGAAKKLTVTMGKAGAGNKEMVANFNELGLSAEGANGKLKSTDEMFPQIINKLADMSNITERNTLGIKIFGKGFMDMAPMLNDGSKGVQALTSEAHKLGLVMSDESVKAGALFDDSMVKVKSSLGAVVTNIGVAVLPTFQKMLDWVINNVPTIKENFKIAFDLVVEKGGKIVTLIMQIVTSIFPQFGVSSNGLKTTLADLTTNGFNLVIAALTWIKNNIPLVQGVLVALTAVWVTQKGIILAQNIALLAHNAQMVIKKGLDIFETAQIKALYIAQGIQTAATWLGHTAMTAFNLVMRLNPIGLVITALAALGLGIVALVKNWDKISAAIKAAWDWLMKWNNEPVEPKTTTFTTHYVSSGDKSSSKDPIGAYGFAVGTRYLPNDMLIQAHEGEMIVPKSENPYANSNGSILSKSGGINQTINIYAPIALSPSETARQNKRVLQESALNF